MLEEKVVVLEEAQSRLLQELVVLESRNSGVGQAIHSARTIGMFSVFPIQATGISLVYAQPIVSEWPGIAG